MTNEAMEQKYKIEAPITIHPEEPLVPTPYGEVARIIENGLIVDNFILEPDELAPPTLTPIRNNSDRSNNFFLKMDVDWCLEDIIYAALTEPGGFASPYKQNIWPNMISYVKYQEKHIFKIGESIYYTGLADFRNHIKFLYDTYKLIDFLQEFYEDFERVYNIIKKEMNF